MGQLSGKKQSDYFHGPLNKRHPPNRIHLNPFCFERPNPFDMQAAQVFEKLLREYGPQGWWPVADSPNGKATYKKRGKLKEFQQFEVCVGAILTQNTAWKNVEKAIENLKSAKLFSLEKIAKAKPGKIAALIKPSGYFNQKTKRLQAFCHHVLKRHKTISNFLQRPKEQLRTELLELHGIGNETADSIILYASQQPVFVVDAYTRRFTERYYGKKMGYDQTQAFFENQLPKDAGLFNEFHALFVEHAKRYCRTKPDCEKCILNASCHHSRRRTEKGKP